MKTSFKLFVLVSIILISLTSCESTPSSGVVTSRIQTSDKFGDPEFYIYILDDNNHHIYQKQVGPTTYYFAKEGKHVSYTIGSASIYNLVIK